MSLLDTALPPDGKWVRLGDVYEITRKPRGLALPALVPFAPMDMVPQGGAYDLNFEMRPAEALTSGTYFERGNVLVAKITPSFENGKRALTINFPHPFGYATTEVIPLRPLGAHDPRFLFYYLLHPDVCDFVAEKMEGATGRQRVPDQVLLDLPFPNVSDETTIAAVLELVQDGIAAERLAIDNVVNLKASSRRWLFEHGLRGEAQKETEIGPIPASWDCIPFSAVREWLQYGTSTRCTTEPAKYPVLRIPNIGAGQVNVENLKYCDMNDADASNYKLESGDLLFIRTNGVLERLGSCAVYDGELEFALFASYLIRARMRPLMLPRFAAQFLGSDLGSSLVAGRATPAADGKYNLNTGIIDSLPLPLPPSTAIQQEIVDVLDAIDSKIEVHKRKHVVLQNLFCSLSHRLISGEIRVSELDLSELSNQNVKVAG